MKMLALLLFFETLLVMSEADPFVVEEPTVCEVCAVLARDYSAAARRRRGKRDELAAIEVLEETLRGLREYKLHKDKTGPARFAKEESATMETVKKLRDRGVKVELGMPEALWDAPAAEVGMLKQRVEALADEHEELLEAWFLEEEDESLENFLCRRVLKNPEGVACLTPLNSKDEL